MKDALEAFASLSIPRFKADGAVAISSLTGAADAFLALSLSRPSRTVLAVTPGIPHADRLTEDLRILADAGKARILEFPPLVEGDKSALALRIRTMAAMRAWSARPYPCVIVAPFQALAAKAGESSAEPLMLNAAGGLGLSELADKLAGMGYERLAQVEKEGDFSVRGGIIDVWSPGEEFPMRAEFFGEELESLRSFNPSTQISIERADSYEILPIAGAGGESGKGGDATTIFDALPENSCIIAIEHNEYPPDGLPKARPGMFTVFTGDPAPKGVATHGFQTSPLPGFAELGAEEAHHPELFDEARKRLERHVEAARKRGDTVAAIDGLSGGFEALADKGAAGGGHALVVVTKADRVFTKRKARARPAVKAMQGQRIDDFDDLEPGEYVVHVDHGVGRYIGSSEISVDGRRSEVFTIEYADGGKLHVPAAHAHLLSRYVGVKGEAVKMHRLDGKRWEKDKEAATKAVADLAAALLETQAKRDTVPGFAYDVHCDGRDAFDAAFPYEETPDQKAAIEAIDADLSSTKPMDRLVCGDAGYGKTEVAMRAAFVAAMNGKQVAVLAPTTVLAEQHFETFTSRFDGTPIRIEAVSRFQSPETRRGTFKRLETGVCDIVIGTHAILSPDIRFHDLGLVVIDEEQRFGVRHKEFLKALRATADVLTLSATPIPRTLYLSMTGARDLSLLRTPPRERVAVESRVMRDSDEAIRAAIAAELSRGGQVFFLHNRVASMSKTESRLRSIAPQARIVVAHGQMDARTLARKMRDFESGKYDILLSTTIVESGLDIPRANTIVIDRADTFGMAELYQLRGRVGRSSRQGYAYFLLPPSGAIDSEARERLAAIKRHGGLGAGFNLAVRDLELRGAGNLLGSQQSGHIATVGFNLYCQLLKRTIARMKGERVREIVDVKLNLDFANPRIPYSYIEEDSLRLAIIRRFAEAQTAREVGALVREMQDRFGPPPPEAEEFASAALLRIECAAARLSNVDVRDSKAVFRTADTGEVAFVETLKSRSPARMLEELRRLVRRR